jgi:uncharacterized protein YjbI with pentapeptide repeats
MKINSNSNYTKENFSDLEFHDDRVEQSEFEDCKFISCNFSESQFVKCKFIDCEFKSSNLNLVKLYNSKFFETDFKDCKITGVNWTSLDWGSFSIVSPIFFESCDISFSVFNSLKLHELSLQNCKAHDVDFSECDLKGADFFRTDLMDSKFSFSKLDRCNFQEAINYYIDPLENSIEGAVFNSPEVLSLLSRFKIKIDET